MHIVALTALKNHRIKPFSIFNQTNEEISCIKALVWRKRGFSLECVLLDSAHERSYGPKVYGLFVLK